MSTPEPTTTPQSLTGADVLTVRQVAAIFHCTENTVRNRARKGLLPGAFRIGRSWVFSNAALRDWVNGPHR